MSSEQEYLGLDNAKNKQEQAATSTFRKKVSKRNCFNFSPKFFLIFVLKITFACNIKTLGF